MLWIRRVYTSVKEKYFSGNQASSHKASDTSHSLRKYNLFSLIQDGENSSWVYAFREGQVGGPRDSKTSNFEENDGDAGMAREQSYPVNSDLNSESKEDKNCRGFNEMYVCETQEI